MLVIYIADTIVIDERADCFEWIISNEDGAAFSFYIYILVSELIHYGVEERPELLLQDLGSQEYLVRMAVSRPSAIKTVSKTRKSTGHVLFMIHFRRYIFCSKKHLSLVCRDCRKNQNGSLR